MHVHPDYRAETAGETLNALHYVVVVVIGSVLNQDGFFNPVQIHLVQDHFHRLEPVDAGVAMGIDNHHVPLAPC